MSERMYHSLVEKARHDLWGVTGLVREEDWEEFRALEPRDKARYLGARVGCPVVETLADHPEYGPSYQVKRYGNVATMLGLLQEDLLTTRVVFSEELGAEVDLTSMGGIQKHDEGWVPSEYMNMVRGAETYPAYVISRQLLDLVGHEKNPEAAVDVLIEAENRVLAARSLPEAVVRLAGLSAQRGIKLQDIHNRIYPSDWAKELPPIYVAEQFGTVVRAFEELWLGSSEQ